MPQTETKEENSEETENVTETNDIYLSEEEEKFYLNVLDKNKSDLEMKLFKFIQGKNIKTTFFRSMENPANTPEIHVFIDNYQSGEFNLIKNVNTQMTYIVEIQNRNKKNIAKIKKTDLETLEGLFGKESDFVSKVDFISGRISDNAEANIKSLSSMYNSGGNTYEASGKNRYDFFG